MAKNGQKLIVLSIFWHKNYSKNLIYITLYIYKKNRDKTFTY